MPRKKKEPSDVGALSTKAVIMEPGEDKYSSENYPNTLLEHINSLVDIFFVQEDFITLRLGTLSYSSIWLKEVAVCATILHKEIKFVIRNHNLKYGNKVVPFAGRHLVRDCLLPFHLAMIKSAELAKNILCLFECNHVSLEVNDNNVRTYFDCMFALQLILNRCNEYVDIMDRDDGDDGDDDIYHGQQYITEDEINE